jgi:hypothetical protein
MKWNHLFVTTAVAGLLSLGLGGCDVEQTEEGELPEINVEGGNLPEYDVDTAELKVGTTETTVSVPDVDVHMEETEMNVPTIGYEPADADGDDD